MKNTTLKNQINKGFSLVEMLVVVAVIGVIAAIAIPSIGGINESAKTTKDQHNAQSIVSVYQAGAAAGVAWPTTKTDAIAKVIAGDKPKDGAFADKTFSVPNVSEKADIDGATKYIDLKDGQLVYAKAGVTAGG